MAVSRPFFLIFSPFFRCFLRLDVRNPESGAKRPGAGSVTVQNGRQKSGRRRSLEEWTVPHRREVLDAHTRVDLHGHDTESVSAPGLEADGRRVLRQAGVGAVVLLRRDPRDLARQHRVQLEQRNLGLLRDGAEVRAPGLSKISSRIANFIYKSSKIV